MAGIGDALDKAMASGAPDPAQTSRERQLAADAALKSLCLQFVDAFIERGIEPVTTSYPVSKPFAGDGESQYEWVLSAPTWPLQVFTIDPYGDSYQYSKIMGQDEDLRTPRPGGVMRDATSRGVFENGIGYKPETGLTLYMPSGAVQAWNRPKAMTRWLWNQFANGPRMKSPPVYPLEDVLAVAATCLV